MEFLIDGGRGVNYNLLDAKGEIYPVFEDSNYVIVGIYDTLSGFSSRDYEIGQNEVIIPQLSVKNSDKNNIASFGPMRGFNTSFQIPNGDIEKYLTAWEKYGTDKLEITFYDKGYSQLQSGIKNMKNMSMIFFIAGVVMVLSVLIFFCHLFIAKQKRRTAIERSLGLSKRKCGMSLLWGILLLIIIGSLIGSVTGTVLTKEIAQKAQYKSYYNTRYGSTVVNTGMEKTSDKTETKGMEYDLRTSVEVSIGVAVLITFVGLTISVIMISINLKKEPLELLGSSGKE